MEAQSDSTIRSTEFFESMARAAERGVVLLEGRELGADVWQKIIVAFRNANLSSLLNNPPRKTPVVFQIYRSLAEAGVAQEDLLIIMPSIDRAITSFFKLMEMREEIREQIEEEADVCRENFEEARGGGDREEIDLWIIRRRKVAADLVVLESGVLASIAAMVKDSDYIKLNTKESPNASYATNVALFADKAAMHKGGSKSRPVEVDSLAEFTGSLASKVNNHIVVQEEKAREGEADTLLRLISDMKGRVSACLSEGFDVFENFIERELKVLFEPEDWAVIERYKVNNFQWMGQKGRGVVRQNMWVYSILALVDTKKRHLARRALARVFSCTLLEIDTCWASISRTDKAKQGGRFSDCRERIDKRVEARAAKEDDDKGLELEGLSSSQLVEEAYGLIDKKLEGFLRGLQPAVFEAYEGKSLRGGKMRLDDKQRLWCLGLLMSADNVANRAKVAKILCLVYGLSPQIFQQYTVAIDGGREGGISLGKLEDQVQKLRGVMGAFLGGGNIEAEKGLTCSGAVVHFGDLSVNTVRSLVGAGVRNGQLSVVGGVEEGAAGVLGAMLGVQILDNPELLDGIDVGAIVGKPSPEQLELLRRVKFSDRVAVNISLEDGDEPRRLFDLGERLFEQVGTFGGRAGGLNMLATELQMSPGNNPVLAGVFTDIDKLSAIARIPNVSGLGLIDGVRLGLSVVVDIIERIVSTEEGAAKREQSIRDMGMSGLFDFAFSSYFSLPLLTDAEGGDGRLVATLSRPSGHYYNNYPATTFLMRSAMDVLRGLRGKESADGGFSMLSEEGVKKIVYRNGWSTLKVGVKELIAASCFPEMDVHRRVLGSLGA